MIHDSLTSPPVVDAATARTILDTLEELDCGLSQRQIELKRRAKAALAYWAAQGLREQPRESGAPCPICHQLGCDSSLANCIERWR